MPADDEKTGQDAQGATDQDQNQYVNVAETLRGAMTQPVPQGFCGQ
jgi:hypothetical protein